MTNRTFYRTVLAFLGCTCANGLAQQSGDPWGPVLLVRISEQEVGDGQRVVVEEFRLRGRAVAWMEVSPRSSNPLAPAPTTTPLGTIHWTVTSASFDLAGEVSAVCELRDDSRLLGRLVVLPRDIAIFTPSAPSIDPRYALVINAFRGRVRHDAVTRVAAGERAGNPLSVRITFPEDLERVDAWSAGIPSIH